MSFSSQIKQELNKTTNLANKEYVKYELLGYLITSNVKVLENKEIKFVTESDYNINRFSKLLTNLDINHKIEVVGRTFIITVKVKDIIFIKIEKEQIELSKIPSKDELKKGIIRGMFLGGGLINNPENKYHLEISLSNQKNQKYAEEILKIFGIPVKILQSKNKYTIYLKDGEEIAKFLALIGANKAVLQFEDIRIQREMRGKINRLVNCETANLNKTINASVKEIEAIQKLKHKGKFTKLNDNLKEIAELRVENPDISLTELGKKLKTPLGKSGVNYRLKKIMEIANDL